MSAVVAKAVQMWRLLFLAATSVAAPPRQYTPIGRGWCDNPPMFFDLVSEKLDCFAVCDAMQASIDRATGCAYALWVPQRMLCALFASCEDAFEDPFADFLQTYHVSEAETHYEELHGGFDAPPLRRPDSLASDGVYRLFLMLKDVRSQVDASTHGLSTMFYTYVLTCLFLATVVATMLCLSRRVDPAPPAPLEEGRKGTA